MVKNSCETVASGNNTSKLVSKIVKQISHRRISISLRQITGDSETRDWARDY